MYVCLRKEQKPLKLGGRWVQFSMSSSFSGSCALALPHRSDDVFTTSFSGYQDTLVSIGFKTSLFVCYKKGNEILKKKKKKGLHFSFQTKRSTILSIVLLTNPLENIQKLSRRPGNKPLLGIQELMKNPMRDCSEKAANLSVGKPVAFRWHAGVWLPQAQQFLSFNC